jgi:ATP-binding cassette subfamily B protein
MSKRSINLINGGLVTIVSQSVSLVGIVIIMFVLNWRLALMDFAVIPGLVWIVARLRPRMETAGATCNAPTRTSTPISTNRSPASVSAKPLPASRRISPKFDELNNSYYDLFMKAIKAEDHRLPLVDVFGQIGSCLV